MRWHRRLFTLLFSLVAASHLLVGTGMVQAASPGEEDLKRRGPTVVPQPQGQPDPNLLPLWSALMGKVSGPV